MDTKDLVRVPKRLSQGGRTASAGAFEDQVHLCVQTDGLSTSHFSSDHYFEDLVLLPVLELARARRYGLIRTPDLTSTSCTGCYRIDDPSTATRSSKGRQRSSAC